MRRKHPVLDRSIFSERGFTLVELVTFIIVGGIFLPASVIAFTSVMSNFSTPDYQVKARFYAEAKMEEVTGQSFSNLTCRAGTAGQTTYTDYPGGYTRVCSINYVQYDSGTSSIVDSGSTTAYKKVTVSVTPAGGIAYDVSTIVSQRPRS
jgi:Tfp pilus assembly protein PilE